MVDSVVPGILWYTLCTVCMEDANETKLVGDVVLDAQCLHPGS
jgi:hypothetical protein